MKSVAQFTWIIGIALLSSCSVRERSVHAGLIQDSLHYAKGFAIEHLGESKLVTVTYPFQGATSGYQYLLVPRGKEVPAHDPKTQVIEIPLSSIVCTSTTHLPHLEYLGLSDKLVGFPTTDYISSPVIRQRVDAGKVKDLGIDKGMDIEQLYELNPGLVMGYTLSADLGQLKKIQELKIPVVLNAEYLERNPLGRAEWIKFTALFFQKEEAADSVFAAIERDYLATRQLTQGIKQKPTVVSGIVYGDTWYMPAGQNYAAQLLEDAGCDYLWSNEPGTGFLELSFESVYTKAKAADLWIGVGSFRTLSEMKAGDSRYALFDAFQTNHVYTYNARMGAKGGNEFLELGYLRPDLILKDLVKIGHPELLPDYTLFFHTRLPAQ